MAQRLVHRLSSGVEIIVGLRRGGDGLSVVTLYRPDNSLQVKLPPCELLGGSKLDGALVAQLIAMNADLLKRFLLPKSSNAASEIAALLQDLNESFMTVPIDDARQQTGLIESAKTIISLTRRVMRRSNEKPASLTLQSTIIGEAYRVMGKVYERLGRLNKAQTSYILSIKTSGTLIDPSTVSALGELLATSDEDRVGDIENILGAYGLKGLNERSGFACSMCGECCRRPNHVLLTPLDLFIICRAPALSVAGVSSTTSLFKHGKFGKAFILEQQGGPEGYPCLRLRNDSETTPGTANCHFSYPLFSHHGGVLMNADDYQLWRREEQELEESSRRFSGILKVDEFTITEEEERMFADRVEFGKDVDQDDDNDEAEKEEEEKEGIAHECHHQSVTPILNSHGRQALGCILGPAHMPSSCLTYPFSYELSVVDEWHSRTKEADQSGSGWEEEEMLVMRRRHGCEGFVDDAVAPGKYYQGPITPLTAAGENTSFNLSNPEGEKSRTKAAGERTVRELLLSAGDDAIDRVKESAWFRGLVTQLARFLPAQSFPEDGGVRLVFSHTLSKIWYDFDGLKTAQTRPIKSWGRLKSEVESRSWTLCQSTKAFLQSDGRANTEKYKLLIERLGLR